MHTFLFVVVTSGLVLLQTTQGLTANLEPDADFLEEAMADGFIVGTTKGPTKTEKPQDNYNAIVTHDSLNPEANLSLFQKNSLPTVTIAKTPKANPAHNAENTNELPKNESAAVLTPVDTRQITTLLTEENAEGSGIYSEWGIKMHSPRIHTSKETVGEADISSDGSGMFSEKPDEDLLSTTTISNSGDLNIFTLVQDSTDENGESGIGSEAPTSNTVEENIFAEHRNNELEKNPMPGNSPDETETVSVQYSNPRHIRVTGYNPEPTTYLRVKQSTPGWLLILALCLTLGAVICVLVGIATKDMWYGPGRHCLNINSTASKKHEEYDKAATLPLSEKEKVALMSAQKEARKKTDCTISIEDEVPEKEYLM